MENKPVLANHVVRKLFPITEKVLQVVDKVNVLFRTQAPLLPFNTFLQDPLTPRSRVERFVFGQVFEGQTDEEAGSIFVLFLELFLHEHKILDLLILAILLFCGCLAICHILASGILGLRFVRHLWVEHN